MESFKVGDIVEFVDFGEGIAWKIASICIENNCAVISDGFNKSCSIPLQDGSDISTLIKKIKILDIIS